MSGRRKQSYCDSYAETFTFIKKSTKGEHHAYCKSCNCDISISAGGANDIKRRGSVFTGAAQKSQVSHKPIAEVFTVYKFTVYKFTVYKFTEVEVRSIILTFLQFTFQCINWNFTPIYKCKYIFCKCILLVLKVYKPMPGAQKSQVSLIVIQIAEVSMFTVYKFTVTEVEVRSIILTFFAVYFSMYKLEFYTFL